MTLKIATWNVNGIRARRDEFVRWANAESPDVICLQEIKASPAQVAESVAELTDLPSYASYWHGTDKGYSGVSLHIRRGSFRGPTAFSHPAFDHETRIVEVRLPGLRVASVYVPNGGKDYPAKLAFLREMTAYVRQLRSSGEPLVLCGDLNVAHREIDVHPDERRRGAMGQRAEERALLDAILAEGDLIDVLRARDATNDRLFTWWPYWREARAKNVGWRIDYVLASAGLLCRDARVSTAVGSSDHAPIVAVFEAEAHPSA